MNSAAMRLVLPWPSVPALAEFFAWIFLQDDFFDEAGGAHDACLPCTSP